MNTSKMLLALAESEEARAEFDANPLEFAKKHKLEQHEMDVLQTGDHQKILDLLYEEVRNLLHVASEPLPKIWSNKTPAIDGVEPTTGAPGALSITLVGSNFPPKEGTEVNFMIGKDVKAQGTNIKIKGTGTNSSTLSCDVTLEKGVYTISIANTDIGQAWQAPLPLTID